ncbi:DUF2637 domain-containing protein [Streptomyces shaanxiensis]|uniref:DUF2637 domain-containing protein n=1 Tax=Streptomyces shaanxiensis TaxID=653357 RepID=UPI0031F17A21
MVVFGAVIIAGIGFAGSYAAVRELAIKKGFGDFSYVFPIGIDAGICVLLALDLLLTWIRIPFPLLRQTAWLLTAATIAFNGAAAWPDPLGVGMHAVIPILFVVAVEAARHAIGRIADITADKHMEGVRLTRWLLSPVPTFLLWRRMKLWELRSYEQVIKLEQERLVYQARLRSRFGRGWRRKAPVESLMPLRLARYGVPLAETAPAGLAAAGIEPALLPPAPKQAVLDAASAADVALETDAAPVRRAAVAAPVPQQAAPAREQRPELAGPPAPEQPEPEYVQDWFNTPRHVEYQGGYNAYDAQEHYEQWYEEQVQAEQYQEQYAEEPPVQEPSPEDTGTFPIPVTGNRTRQLGEGGGPPEPADPTEEDYYQVFKKSIGGTGYPTPREFSENVEAEFSIALLPDEAKRLVTRFTNLYNTELEENHIA